MLGLEADRLVASELRMTLADVRAGRDQGLTTVLVAPSRGLFRGLSAMVPLRDDTATRQRAQRALVDLELSFHPGLTGQSIGTWSETYAGSGMKSYAEQRADILASLHDVGPDLR